ncbi:MAG: hypothetical protein H7177_01365 [Rhizobacter sp.]|nr:hypothetical protein [Bacteriovorax sp.]
MADKPNFMNFTVDHMTLLLHPKLYSVAYPVFRIIFGVRPEDILYDKRRPAKGEHKEKSMTFATRIGDWKANDNQNQKISTVIAVVQPSEPDNEPSHVREMLDDNKISAHWQHIALRTPDLISFYKHALEHGVQFVTPILKDEEDNLIQVFSGEWFIPGSEATGLFFEFLQRNPSSTDLEEIQKTNGQTWFRDQTFLGLYAEKEREYQSKKVAPFIPEGLFNMILNYIGDKQVWQLTEDDISHIATMMKDFTKKNS